MWRVPLAPGMPRTAHGCRCLPRACVWGWVVSTDLFGAATPMTNAEVLRMTRPEREARVRALVLESHAILDRAIEQHIDRDGKALSEIVVLFSGGNDSTVLAHMFRERATYAAHANTTIGIEDTRQFVRDTCKAWRLPLAEQTPPNVADHYRALVLAHGFPGPAQHFKMYQRLKERALRAIQADLVGDPRRNRIVFLAGRRRDESARRSNVVESERIGSAVWVSPLVHWTKADLTTYRQLRGDVPTNRVSDLIHMSGECLCGSFAKRGEREELRYWFPATFAIIEALEAEIADRDDIPAHRRVWGWGADRSTVSKDRRVGLLCSSCVADQPELFEASA